MSFEEEKINIEKLDTLCKLLEKSGDVSEFLLNCTMNGIAFMTDKDFYDKLYEFMFDEVTNRKLLKYKVILKKNLPKLSQIFNYCNSEINIFEN